jgi:hypothetical protein
MRRRRGNCPIAQIMALLPIASIGFMSRVERLQRSDVLAMVGL